MDSYTLDGADVSFAAGVDELGLSHKTTQSTVALTRSTPVTTGTRTQVPTGTRAPCVGCGAGTASQVQAKDSSGFPWWLLALAAGGWAYKRWG